MSKLNNFHYAMFLTNEMFGINILPEKFEEMGLIAWGKIGNKRTRLYKACLDINKDNTVELPDNCDIIEAVTYGFEDYEPISSVKDTSGSQFVEHYIEAVKGFSSPYYLSGRYIKYERVGDTLYLEGNYTGKIFILYKGEILDDEGLPQITDEEAMAIAYFIAYVTKQKELWGMSEYAGTMRARMELVNLARKDWLTACDQARIPDSISQNEMNEILDAKTSWNRKIYNKSYKPVK